VRRIKAGATIVFANDRLRRLVLLAWLATFTVVPEALAIPYATGLNGGAAVAGVFLAAQPVGAVAGSLVLSRLLSPARRERTLAPLAVLALAPLLVFVARPAMALTAALLVVSGFGSAYQMLANAVFVPLVPAAHRAQAFGLAVAGLVAGQGIGIAVAGVLAEAASPAYVIAGAGAVGLAALPVLALRTAW
jgi:MFS family permease